MISKIFNGKLLIFAACIMLAGIVFAGTVSRATLTPGDVWTWGYNRCGQLGDGTTTDRYIPVHVDGISNVTAIAAGGGTCGYTLALKSDGTVWAWGVNEYGELGIGVSDYDPHPTPAQVIGISNVTAIAVGRYHAIALKSDGTVWAWGENNYGQSGSSTLTSQLIPVQVSGLSNVIAIAGGRDYSVALKSDGTVWTWGGNGYGYLGTGVIDYDPHPIPAQVIGLSNVIAIAAGREAATALKSDGTVWAWGQNNFGQLGIGVSDYDPHPSPVQVIGISNVTAISAGATGYDYTYAFKSDGTVWAWGANTFGALGIGTSGTNQPAPVQVIGLSNVKIAAGGFHAIALKPDGTVWAWGYNYYGQLGDNTTIDRYSPVQTLGPEGIGYLNKVGEVSGGRYHTAALIANHRQVYSGILPPIRADGSSIFKLGSTVPVKFRITDANGNYVSTATATLTYQLITNEILGTVEEAASTGAANEGNTFRYDSTDNLYIFNLGTKGMNTGTYQLNINLDDGTVHTVRISLR